MFFIKFDIRKDEEINFRERVYLEEKFYPVFIIKTVINNLTLTITNSTAKTY